MSIQPKAQVKVGDEIQMKVTLTGAGRDFDELFWAKITEPEKSQEKSNKPETENEPLGLPDFVLLYEEEKDDKSRTWSDFSNSIGEEMDFYTVMFPLAEGDNLEKIYINMDSNVFRSFLSKTKNPNEEQILAAERKYISSVYFHTLFLYTITKNRGYQISRTQEGKDEPDPIDLGTYLKDLFDHYYSSFILNFGGMEEILEGLGD